MKTLLRNWIFRHSSCSTSTSESYLLRILPLIRLISLRTTGAKRIEQSWNGKKSHFSVVLHFHLPNITGMRLNINLIFHYLNWFRLSFRLVSFVETTFSISLAYLWSLQRFSFLSRRSSDARKFSFYFSQFVHKMKEFFHLSPSCLISPNAWKSFLFTLDFRRHGSRRTRLHLIQSNKRY